MPTEHSRLDPMSWPTHSFQQVDPSFPSALPPGFLLPRSWPNVVADNDGLTDGKGPQLRPTIQPRPADLGKGGQKGSGRRDKKEPRPLGIGEVAAQVKGTMASILTHRVSDMMSLERKRTRKKEMDLAYEMRQQRKRGFEFWHGT